MILMQRNQQKFSHMNTLLSMQCSVSQLYDWNFDVTRRIYGVSSWKNIIAYVCGKPHSTKREDNSYFRSLQQMLSLRSQLMMIRTTNFLTKYYCGCQSYYIYKLYLVNICPTRRKQIFNIILLLLYYVHTAEIQEETNLDVMHRLILSQIC